MNKIIDITPEEDRLPSTDLVESNLLDEINYSFDRIIKLQDEQIDRMKSLFKHINIILDTEEIDFEEIK